MLKDAAAATEESGVMSCVSMLEFREFNSQKWCILKPTMETILKAGSTICFWV